MRRSRHSVWPLVILLALVVAAMIYFARPPASAPPAGSAANPSARLGPIDIYPNAAMTPGATNPDITQQNISDTICSSHWSTRSIRPSVDYTQRLKHVQIHDYGDSDVDPRDYEEDHLIPLELGGSPTDPKNLWPEPFNTSIRDGGAHAKDRVENYLHDQVCSGAMPLAAAQQEIAVDWYRVYVSEVK